MLIQTAWKVFVCSCILGFSVELSSSMWGGLFCTNGEVLDDLYTLPQSHSRVQNQALIIGLNFCWNYGCVMMCCRLQLFIQFD